LFHPIGDLFELHDEARTYKVDIIFEGKVAGSVSGLATS
jgi:hypothetical protein